MVMPDETRECPVKPEELRELRMTIYRCASWLGWEKDIGKLNALADWLEKSQQLATERAAHAEELRRVEQERDANSDKVKALNLLLTAVNPTVRILAERYLEGVKDMESFVEFLRTHPLNEAAPEPPSEQAKG